MTINTQQHLDKIAIREVLSGYSICVDTGDDEGFAALFTSDCQWQWQAAGLNFKGREALKLVARAVAKYAKGTQHAITNWIIEVHGDTATSTSQFTCFLSRPEKIYCLMLGYYKDQLVRKGDDWLIEKRVVQVENPELLSQGKIGELFAPLGKELLAIAALKFEEQ